jgi:uncharacterized membrane protein YhaH (DUF805 family)
MSFVEAVQTCFQKYVVFSGRASRPEFWYWILFYVLASFLIGTIDNILGVGGWLRTLFTLAAFLPWIAVSVRRLHDIGHSAWFLLLLYGLPVLGINAMGAALWLTGPIVTRTGQLVSAPSFSSMALALGVVGVVLNLLGFVLSVYFFIKPGELQTNAYGPSPEGSIAA